MYSLQFINPCANCGLPEMFLLIRQIRNQKHNCVLGTHSIASQITRSTQQLSCSLRCSAPSPGAGQQLTRPPAPLHRAFYIPLSPLVLCLISKPDIFAVIFPKSLPQKVSCHFRKLDKTPMWGFKSIFKPITSHAGVHVSEALTPPLVCMETCLNPTPSRPRQPNGCRPGLLSSLAPSAHPARTPGPPAAHVSRSLSAPSPSLLTCAGLWMWRLF